jgi:aspartate kinase
MEHMTTVLKFGGTSVGDGETIRELVSVVRKTAEDGSVAVVVSAMSGVSNSLLSAADSAPSWGEAEINDFAGSLRRRHIEASEIAVAKNRDALIEAIDKVIGDLRDTLPSLRSRTVTPESIAKIAAYGEKLSAPIVSAAIADWIPSEYHYGDDCLIITDDNFLNAEPLMTATRKAVRKKLIPQLEGNTIPVVTGFMGCNRSGQTTILGRGSSDHISAILGACLDAREVQIWTDVDGLLTADPKIVESAKLIKRISFNEASELAYFGAKVLHPKTVLPAMQKDIPIRILNLRNRQCPGTLIVNTIGEPEHVVTAITVKKGITLIEILSTKMLAAYGFLARIFGVFAKYKVSVDMLSTTEVSVSLTIDQGYEGEVESFIDDIRKIANVEVMRDKALVCVIGEGMKSVPGIAGRIFSCLGANGINVKCISQGALQINISFVVDSSEADRAVRLLHDEIILNYSWS